LGAYDSVNSPFVTRRRLAKCVDDRVQNPPTNRERVRAQRDERLRFRLWRVEDGMEDRPPQLGCPVMTPSRHFDAHRGISDHDVWCWLARRAECVVDAPSRQPTSDDQLSAEVVPSIAIGQCPKVTTLPV
jgi:hypothetical protein